MSKPADALTLIDYQISQMCAFIRLAGNSPKCRDIVVQAIAEDRNLRQSELEHLRVDAQAILYRMES